MKKILLALFLTLAVIAIPAMNVDARYMLGRYYSDYEPEETDIICEECDGSGQCQKCDGYGHYWDILADEEVDCPDCGNFWGYGEGECPQCEGKGYFDEDGNVIDY